MRTWFAHKTTETPPAAALATVEPGADSTQAVEPARKPAASNSASNSAFVPRRLIYAPVLSGGDPPPTGNAIRIKAQVIPEEGALVLMVDRPLLVGYSYLATTPAVAADFSPLALVLLEHPGVSSVLIHAMNITVTFDDADQEALETSARQLGQTIRAYLQSGQAVMTESFFATMPGEDDIREALQTAIDDEIGPGISGHSGEITLTNVIGNTAYIKMGGGCQGCAASSITLRRGIDQSFRRAVPQLGALLDETDHAAGINPFFTELPAEMRG